MSEAEDTLDALREALSLSPENVVLRRQLGRLLLRRGLLDEAEKLFRAGLDAAPQSEALKLGLAQCYAAQGKRSPAMVIVEELVQRPDATGTAHLLHARLLLRLGELEKAGRAYRRAVEVDPTLVDEELAEAVGADESSFAEESDDESSDDWRAQDGVDDRGRVRLRADAGPEVPDVEMEKPKLTFDDVGGMHAVKEEVRLKIIEPMNHAELFASYGKSIGGGVLMYGPPGCGKTHLARATAGQVNAGFISVGIHDVLDMFLGASEQKLHALFQYAREHTPCVLFFDEVDALGAKRADLRQSVGRTVINQFLAELDGVDAKNDGVLVLAATNSPWHLDAAFRRPGRFDRIIFVPPPDAPGRASILRVLLKGKPQDAVDTDAVAAKTDRFSGADLKAVVDTAIEGKLRDALKTGRPQPLTTKDLIKAAKTIKPSTRDWFATAKNYALYANEAGAYDDVLDYLKK